MNDFASLVAPLVHALGKKGCLKERVRGTLFLGRTAAILSSLIATCKRLTIDPFAYLRDIFEGISSYPQYRLNELLPDRWRDGRRSVILS